METPFLRRGKLLHRPEKIKLGALKSLCIKLRAAEKGSEQSKGSKIRETFGYHDVNPPYGL
jgi:hypothetical protein